MSNEELAIQIQDGNTDLLPALYEQVGRLINQLANRYYNHHTAACNSAGVTVEDLYQEGYIALLDAVRAYDRDGEYRFTSYLDYPLKNHFNALAGIRTKKRHPLNESVSLELPIAGEDADITLGDSIADTEAPKAYEQVEEDVYTAQLHTALEECLNALEKPLKSIVTGRYYDDLSLQELADRYSVTRERVRQYEAKGLRKLRSGQALCILRPYRENIISSYKGGCGTFQSHSASIEEIIAEQREQVRKWRELLENSAAKREA